MDKFWVLELPVIICRPGQIFFAVIRCEVMSWLCARSDHDNPTRLSPHIGDLRSMQDQRSPMALRSTCTHIFSGKSKNFPPSLNAAVLSQVEKKLREPGEE